MLFQKLRKQICLGIIMILVSMVSFSEAVASRPAITIYGTSIKWNDEMSKTKLLATVPKWHNDSMKALFNAYRHPEKYQLPSLQSPHYNAQFINAFWGPLSNPFNQYPRPAKAFVGFSKNNKPSKLFYMVPLIQNQTDSNYYVFDQKQTQPILLNEWVMTIQREHVGQLIWFNVCNGYGRTPSDSCQGTSYQSENRGEEENVIRGNAQSLSAHRDIHESWQMKASAMRFKRSMGGSIYEKSIEWAATHERNQLLNTVVTWPNYQSIQANFEKIRDIRYFQDEGRMNFERRITWLYPDDGCWTRASAVIKDLFGPFNNLVNAFPRPSKIFAFGDLCANTPHSPDGQVSWWYHTAPIVKDAQTNQTYVLDPSINPYKPLPTEQWIAAITSQSGACGASNSSISVFNICNGYGPGPYNSCNDPQAVNFQTEADEAYDQRSYRRYELERQIELGRDVERVLGDLPPWLE